MTVGEKIKKFRIKNKLTQKQLAIMSGMSEPAIRNYELGNRTPSQAQLEKIANALGINLHSLTDPNFDTYTSVMHSLFALEEQYGLHVEDSDGKLCLCFTGKGNISHSMMERLESWAKVYSNYQNGKIDEEVYLEWKATFPGEKDTKL